LGRGQNFISEGYWIMSSNTRSLPAGGSRPLDGESKPASGFVALSRFVVANGLTTEVKDAFRKRPHLVDNTPGYHRMEVISPVDHPKEIWLLTFWTDEASFRTWHHSHLYHESHRGIPKGLKLLPGETSIRHFEHVAS
jgi:heme-degrading monooxygenase HmoA